MSYPPDNRGYYSGDPSGGYGVYSPDFGAGDRGESPLPRYLSLAVVLLGAAAYLLSFGPGLGDGSVPWGVRFALLAALGAALGRLSRHTPVDLVVAVLAAGGFLDALAALLMAPEATPPGWALTVIVVVNGLQAACAVGVLALRSGLAGEAARSQYDAYADYYEQMAYYGQYAQQQPEQPEQMRTHATGQAQQVAAARPERAPQPQAAQYADYIGNHQAGQAQQVNRPSAHPGQPTTNPSPQAGLPSVGHAQTSAHEYGERGGPDFRPPTSH